MKYLVPHCNYGGQLGHQFANWNTGYTLAHRYGLRFIHREIAGWDGWLGFGEGEVKEWQGNEVHLPMLNLESQRDELERILVETPDETVLHLAFDQNMADQTETRAKLRAKYWARHTSSFTEKVIAVHVRRGDLTTFSESDRQGRWVELPYVRRVLEQLPSYPVHIYSQGKRADFAGLEGVFHLNESDYDTFHGLASAEVMVMGKSGFSYFAGLLNPHTVVGMEFWHVLPADWLKTDKEGNIV